jgi:7-carboxy-7-deazaguanine synthase
VPPSTDPISVDPNPQQPSPAERSLMVNEVFYSIQGESTWAGMPCVFVRLMGCHLRCGYCDTEYAFFEGKRRELRSILEEVRAYGCPLVELTGGEPLLQPAASALLYALCEEGHTTLLETSGACDIGELDPRVIRIMDLKTPDSGECERNLWSNLEHLRPSDEVKFVLCSRGDYEWAREVIRRHRLIERVKAVLMSPAAAMPRSVHLAGAPGLPLRNLAEWVLEDRLPVRLQTQLHKLIWDPMARGV